MKLALKTFTIKEIVLGGKTGLRKGVLTVNEEELRALLLKDNILSDVTFDVARLMRRAKNQ